MSAMLDLIETLNEASRAYYNGNPIMSDEEYDLLYEKLEDMEEYTGLIYGNSPTHLVGSPILEFLKPVSLTDRPMLSLDKVHTAKEIIDFAHGKTLVATVKCDGLSTRLIYENGNLVKACTRGDGETGVDVTEHVQKFLNVPSTIPLKTRLVVDGESVIKNSDFELINRYGQYKNPRNLAAGTLNSLDTSVVKERRLSFIAWDVIEGSGLSTYQNRITSLHNYGFDTVLTICVEPKSEADIEYVNDLLFNSAEIPSDGVVWKFNDIKYGDSLGRTAKFFNNAIAWKPEIVTAETTLLDIDWTMGRTGVLTPVAVFDEVDLLGSTVSRASLHNLSIMEDLIGEPRKGQTLTIYRANMIIPQVLKGDKKYTSELIPLPDICPICGAKLVIDDSGNAKVLKCVNPKCSGQLINKLDHYAGKKGLDIKGLSKATLEKLIDWGWVNSILDLYSLKQYKKEWMQKPGFGEKSVNNILEAIELAKSPTLNAFISALGIPNVGSTMAKELLKYIESYNDFRQKVDEKWDFSSHIPGIGYVMNDAILKFDYTEADKISKLLDIKIPVVIKTEQTLKGANVVITGRLVSFKNRDELKAAIEQHGGRVSSSVSGNTTYLVNNDATSTSAKNQKAHQLNIPILTEAQFIEKFLT